MLFPEAQKFALNAAKEIVVACSANAHTSVNSAKDVAELYETIYRQALALATEVKP